MKKFIIKFFADSKFKTFVWLTLEGFLSYAIVYLTGLNYTWVPFITAILAIIVKYINTNYLQTNKTLKKIL